MATLKESNEKEEGARGSVVEALRYKAEGRGIES
jgi:hypothetical protein